MIYLGNINIGGSLSLEQIAKHATDALHEAGMLDRVICRDYTGSIPNDKVVRIKGSDEKFDRLAAEHIEDGDLLFFWDQQGYESVKKAFVKDMKLVCERASSHPLYQAGILSEEYEKFGMGRPIPRSTILKSIETYNLSDFVLVPSEYAHSTFVNAGFPEEKLKIIHYGVDCKKFKPKKEEHEGFKILWVGGNPARKGLRYLLEAMAELPPDVTLTICGCSPSFTESTSRIEVLGVRGDMERIYPKHDLFVLPSFDEGDSLTAKEAWASGLPVITTRNAGVGHIMEHGRNGFFIEPRDVERLRDHILYYYDNPPEVKKHGRRGRDRVKGYSWGRYRREFAGFIESVVG